MADGATGTTSGTTTINADLLLNDVDIDSDDLTITEVDGDTSSVGKATSGSDGGSFTIRADGSWEFNPGTDFDDLKAGVTKTTSVEYTATDGTLTDTATLTVTVTGANDGLTANDDAGTTTENTDLTVADGATGTTSGTTTINADLLLNDIDIDGDDLTITEVDGDTGSVGKAVDGSDGGKFTIRANGSWEFNPGTDFDDLKAGVTKTTSVEYTASDGSLTDTATLTVTVTGANDGLTANDDAGTTTENTDLTVADGATGTTSGTTTGPGGGAQRVNADLLLNDVDIDGDDLTITEVDGDTSSVGKATNGSDGGSFTIRANGSWEFNPGTDFDDLKAGVTKTTSVEYTASDGTLTDTATLTVTVTGANDGLTANDDAGTTTENTELTVADGATGTTSGTTTINADLLLNDVDIDGDDLTITEVDGDTASVGKATGGSDGGSFTLRANGSWEFNPGTDFDDLKAGVTKTTSVEYTASDGSLTDTATLTVTVTGTNDGLTANDDAGTTTENTDLTVADGATGTTSGTTPGPGGGAQRVNADLLLNDVDIDSDDLTITEVDGESSSVGKATSGSDGGSFTIRANGSWEFNPGTDFDDLKAGVTKTTSVEYTASDGSLTDTATLTVTVTGTNDGLTANDDSGTTTENTDLTVADGATGTTNADLLLNDVDIDGDDLTITEVDGDTSSVGKATGGSDGGSFTIRADGSWDFDPGTAFNDLAAGATKTTSVVYTASDGSLTDTATLTVTVTGANDGLTANDDSGTTTENTDLTVADGATGTTSGTTPGPGGGAQRVNADLLLNDVDIDGDDLTITEVDGDTGSVGKATDGSDGGSFTIDSKGGWTFDPNSDFDDLAAGVTRTTSVVYTASDGTLTDTATLTVTVTGTNDGLTANDDAGTTTENKILTVADGATGTTSGTTTGPGGGAQRVNADLLLNDVDIDGDDLTITEVDGESSSVGKAIDGSNGGKFTIDSKGGWTFDPDGKFGDLKAGVTRTTSVVYTASDGSLTDTATLTVTVRGTNDGLTANDDAGTTTENKMLTVADGATGTTSGTTTINADLLLNDVDIDGDDLTITEVDGDTGSVGKATDGSDGGSFTIDSKGGWTFDPNSDFDDLAAGVTRTTSVVYTASDGTLTDTATLTVTVTGTNDGLTANDDAGTTTENKMLTVADGATGTTSGTTPGPGGGAQRVNADLLLNDVDIDGDDLTITEVDGDTGSVGKATDGSDGGSFTIDSKGGWTFDPNSDFDDLAAGVTRTTSVVYTASDGTLTDTATLTVTVTGTNDGLTANDDAGTTTENKILTVADGATGTTSGTTTGPGGGAQRVNADLLLNDVDIDGDDLTITEVDGESSSVGKAIDGSNGGKFTIDSKGGWTFDPDGKFGDLKAGVTRTTSVVYTASDGSLTDTATLTVTVRGTNDGLTANDDAGTTTENKMLTVADGATGTTSGTTTTNADLLLNDVDIDGDDLTITEVDGDTGSVGKATDGSDGGSFTIDSKGGWTFDPNSDFDDLAAGVTRITSVVYTASDGTLTDTATLTVTVTGSNDGLTANDDAGTTTENKMLTVADGATGTTSGTTPGPGGGAQRVNADLLLNDVDIDGDDLTITEVDGDTGSVGKATDGSDGGSFTIDSKGGWTFDPNSDFDDLAAGVTRTTSVEYTASDGTLTDTATLTVTVTGTNDGLTANDDAGTTTENKMLTVADGATGTTSGTTPGPGGGAQRVNADLLLNDVDIDGDDLTITEVDGDTGSVGKATDGSDGGSFTIDSKGGWTFDPNSDFDDLAAGVTRTTSVVYTASDGTLTDTATLTVTVTGTNDGLTANDDAGTTTENKMLTVADGATGTTSGTTTTNADLLLNDVDIDGDDLTITEVDGDTGSVGKATDGSDGGSFTIDSKGGWTFDPNSDFDDLAAGVTRTTSVEYTASDGTLTDTATLTVTVTGTNDGLTANDDAGTTTENKMLTVADGATGTTSGTTPGPGGGAQRVNADLLLNDVDIDGDDLTITEVDGDTGSVGKATDGSDGGSFTIDSKGGWTFDPNSDFDDLAAGVTRTTSVVYTASDGTLTDTATLTVTVTGTNDGLTANDDAGTTTENKMLTVADGATGTTSGTTTINADLLLNDVDIDGDDLTITEVDGDTGSVGKATDGSDGGSFTIDSKGGWAFDPNSDFDDLAAGVTRTTSVVYTASDGTLTDTATLTVTVTGTNDGLTANDDAGTTTENKMLTVADGATGTTSGTTTTNADLLLNDVDIDGDDLTITEVDGDTGSVGKATDGSDGGSFTIDSKGGWTFDPNSDFDDLAAGVTRTTSVVYTASDGTLTDTATLTVTVTGTNDGLTANDDAGTTTENTELTVADGATGTTSGTTTGPGGGAQRVNADLLLNDVDIDGDDLTITEVDGDTGSVGKATDGSDGGSFTIDSKGGWTFDPNSDFDDLKAGVTRTTSVEYTASDGTLTDTATLTVTVTGANDGLTANDDAGTTTENKMLTVADGATGTTSGTTNADLLLNDVDIDGDDLTITEVDGDTGSVGKATDGSDGGSFTIDSKGGWTFDPNSDFDDLAAGVTRTTSVEYTASDGTLTDTATLTVTVTGSNDGLTANDDAGTTTENTELTVADGATGTMTVNRDLLLNDVDIDSDDLTITEVDGDTSSVGKATNGSDGGSFTLRANGSWEFNPGTDFDDLKAGVTKTTSVEYTASDGSLTDTATLTVTVTGSNDGLTANDDAGTTTENTELTVADGATGPNADLLLNDVDIDSDDLTITEVDGESSSVGKATSGSDGGSFTIRANGSWEFNPGTDFDDLKAGVTRTTSVEYTASDGTLTDTATLTVTVRGTNDGLTANDDAGTTTENTELTVADGATGTTSGTTKVNADLLLNDKDDDGDTLTISEVGGDTASVGKAIDGSDGGKFTIRANGSWEFNPGKAFDDLKAGVTRTTSVEYTASDGTLTDTATLTVTVTGANDGLTANDDAGTTTENTDLIVADGATGTTSGTTPGPGGGAQRVNADLLLNDVDIDSDDLTITEVDGDTGSVGKATTGSGGGSFTIRADGSWDFNPGTAFDDLKAGVTRTTSVEYTASDGTLTDTATLTVTVTGTNDGLTANDDAGTTTENTELTVADGATGTTSGTTPGPGGGAQRVNADLLLNDVDIDGDDLTITEVDGESSSVGKATSGSDGGSFTIRANGSWEFNPGTDFDDLKAGVTKTTSVEYTASDGSLTDTATLTVTVTGANDGLTANDDSGTTTENTELTVADGATGITSGTTNADLLLNDVDIDGDDLTITEVDGDTSSVGKATSGSDGGSFTIRANGSWEFNPGTDFDDLKAGVTKTTSVEYTASDGSLTDTATLTVTVTGTNDGLTANDDAGTTTENTDLTVADGATGTTSGTTTINADLLLNDVDIDSDDLTITEVDGDTSSVGKATSGSDGGSFTIRADGSWEFNPGTDFDDLKAGVTKTTSVEYTATDGTLTDTATLTVTVTGANDGLTANDDAGTTTENTDLTVADGATGTTSGTTTINADLLLNDIDIDGDDLTITEVDGDTGSVGKAVDGSDGGKFTIRANGSWEFNPGTDFDDLKAGVTKTTSVEYTASDGSLTDTATLTVTVTGANDGLTANDDAGTTTENTDLTVADGATGTTSGTTTGPGGGAQRVNADLLLNDVDIDGDDLTITEVDGDTSSVGKATNGSDGGSFTIRANGSWEFNPGTDFDDLKAGVTKTTSVEYTASDGTLTDTATLTVTVTGANDGLTANDDAGTTTENTELTVADGATGTTSGTTTINADLLLNDVDIDGDDLTITEVDGDTASVGKATGGSDGGSFTLRANGSWEFNPGTDFDDLKAGVTKTTSVEYTASDGSLTDTATLTVTVTGTNDGLTANDDAGTTTENTDLTVADGATGTTSGTTPGPGGGAQRVNADLLLNDVDIDSDDLTITEVDGESSSVGKATSGSDGGSFTIRANGSWEFNPGTDFDDLKAGVTKTTSVEYTASDGSLTDTATLTVTVTGTNDGLTANDDSGTTTENTDLTVADGATGTTNADLLLNDVDIDGDDLTITEVDGDTSSVGKATGGSDGGSFTIRADGSWDFDPGTAFNDLAAGATKTTSVVYTASDGSLTDTATLTVTVTGANDGLTANDDSGTTTENTDLTVADGATGTTSGTTPGPGGGAQRVNADLLLNDVDIDGDDLTITEVDGDTGSVGKATDGSDGGSFTIDSKGGWTFDPNSDFDDLAAGVTRTTSVVYTASDGTLTDTATLTVTVTGTNDGLTANDDAGTTTENKILTVADGATGTTSGTTTGPGGGAQRVNADLLLNDVDIDGDDLTITEVDGESSSVGKAIDGSNGGKFTIDSKGGWTFDPDGKFGDLKAGVTRTTSVVYTASDGSLTDTATLTVTVRGTNDGLTANDDAGTTTENKMLTVADGATGTTSGTTTINADLLLNDVDIDGDDLTITEVDGDTGSVGKATDGSDGGSFTIDSKGGWTFDPNSDFDDLAAGVTRTTSVVYTASDGTLTDTATLTVTVTGTNDGLTANDDAGTTTENKMLTVADGATGTTSGTTPGPGGGAQRVNADLLLNDVDIDGDDLTITEVDGDTGSVGKATDGSDGGSFTIDSKGGWTFDPNSDFDDLAAGVTRTTSVVYTASDGTLTDTATLTVTVTGTNDGLTANDDAGTTTENKILTVADGATGTTSGTTTGPGGGAQRVNADLLLNDVDIDGDDLTITEVDGESSSVGKAIDGSNGGKFTIDSKGGWTFDPDGKFGDLKAGVTRTTSVVYTASDGSLTDTATLTVTVRGTNDGLTANDDAGTTTENKMLTVADGATGTTSGTTTTNADLLLNDVDIDGDDLTITEVDGDTGSVGKATDGSDGGSFTIDSKGGWTFDPNSDFDDLAAGVTRITSVVYTASDGTLTDTATLTVTVTGSNDGLTANDDAGTTTENKMLTVADGATGTTSGTTPGPGGGAQRVNADLLLNDVDIDGDDLTITEVDGDTGSVGKATDGSDGGSFTIDSKGGWTFDPNSDFDDLAAGVTRTTSVEYTASDGTLTDTATLTVTVTGTNDGLTANDDAGTTTENKMLTVADGATGTTSGTTPGPGGGAQRVNADLLLNDVDIDGDDLTITEVDGDTGSVGKATDGSDGGSFTIDSKGGWTFDPNSDFDDLAAGVTRTTSVVYTASDGTLTDTATLTVTVTGTNDGLTANDDAGTTTENKMLTVADGATGTTSGTTTTNADLLLNDVDIDGDDLTITEVDGDTGSVGKATDGSDGGSFTIDSKGGWTFDPNSDFDDLAAGVTRTTSVEYTASDGTLTDTATLTVTVTGTNDGLTANDDAGTTTENKMLTVADGATGTTSGTTPGPGGGAQRVNADLLLNDVDIDGDDLTITEVDGDTGSVGKATDGSDGGSFTIDSKGGWTFDPNSDFDDLAAGVTRTTSVVYTASDGTLTDTATLTVTVTGTNDGLTANDDAGTTTENKMLTVADGATGTTSGTTNADLLLNDVDIDGDDLTITEVDGESSSVGKATDGSDGGSFTIDSKGGWTFDPNSDFDNLAAGVTRTTSVVYTASDGTLTDTATLTVTVTGANDGLTANDDAGTTTENKMLTVADGATGTTSGTTTGPGGGAQRVNADLLLNDVDIDGDDLTITEVDGDTGSVGKATGGSDGGSFTIDSKGGWTFDPNSDFDDLAAGVTRTTSVVYTASDGTLTDTATLTVTVTGTNDGLTANDDAGTTTENKMLTVADGATGTTSGTTPGPGGGAQRVNADLLLNDVDIDGDDLTITEVDGDTGSVGKATDGSDGGSFTIDSKGGWTFDPNSDFDDLAAGVTRTTSVVYTASDGTLTDTATLTVTVTGTNDGLTANDDAGTTTENTDLTVADGATGTTSGTTPGPGGGAQRINADLLLNDVDIDGDDLTITEVDGDTGSVGKATDGSDGGSFTIDSKGGWTFDPNSDFDDLAAGVTRTTSVVYTASDGTLTDTATLTVTVSRADDEPTLTPDTGTVTEDAAVDGDGNLVATGTVTATGGNDGEDQLMAATLTGSVGELTIAADGTWTWKVLNSKDAIQDLNPTATLTDTFTVTGSDGVSTTSVTITINGANDDPTLALSTGSVTEDIGVNDDGHLVATGSVRTSGGDAGEDRFVEVPNLPGERGSLQIGADGHWIYQVDDSLPAVQALGAAEWLRETFTVHSSDLVTTTTVTITITGTNDAPTANDDTGRTIENTPLTVADGKTGSTNSDLLLNDLDIDGDDLIITEVNGDTANIATATDGNNGGSFIIHADGSYTFDPGTDFDDLATGDTRTTSITYTASDGTATDTATLTITVSRADDEPIEPIDTTTPTLAITAPDTSLIAGETTTVTFGFSEAVTGFTDADISATGGTLSRISADANGITFRATFTPELDYNGPATIRVGDSTWTDLHNNEGTGHALHLTIETIAPALDTTRFDHRITDGPTNDGDASDTDINPTPTILELIRELNQTKNVFDGSDQFPPPSPVSLISPLTDQQVTAGGAQYDISDLFGHTDDMPLWFTASLISGNLLPYYVQFDSETGIFQFDIDAAAEVGANSLQIRVIAVDPDGNQASGVFRVDFPNIDEGIDKNIDESTDDNTDDNTDADPDAASDSPEQQNPGPES